jgi:hypothetical protein
MPRDPRVPGPIPGRGQRPVLDRIPPVELRLPDAAPRIPSLTGSLGGIDREGLGLSPDTPLLLLPVRLETKYRRADQELRIRVFPDQIHLDSDDPGLTAHEIEAGGSFWTQYAGADQTTQEALWVALCEAVGENRAGHVARTVRAAPGPLSARDVDPPASTVLLPHRWNVLCFQGDQLVHSQAGAVIDQTIEASPDPLADTVTLDASGLQVSPATAWMFDWDTAVEVGMAMSIDLRELEGGPAFSTVLVLGLRPGEDPQAAAAEFAEVLEMHERSSGLAFVPDGTATNNVPDEPAGWTKHDRQLRAAVKPEATAYDALAGRNAAVLARALGLADPTCLARAKGSRRTDRQDAVLMNKALYEPVLGHYVDRLLGDGVKPGLDHDAELALRKLFIDEVAGGSPLPALRIGPQPYGILPIGILPPPSDGTTGHLVRILDLLEPEWRRSVDNVVRIDPNATDTVIVEGDSDVPEPVDLIPAVLASQPHAARVFSRTFYSLDDDFWAFLSPQRLYSFMVDTWIPQEHPELVDYIAAIPQGATIDTQISLWEFAKSIVVSDDDLDDGIGFDIPAQRKQNAIDTIDSVLLLLGGWEFRQRPHRTLGLPRWNGALGHPHPPQLVDGRYGTEQEWSSESLIGAADVPDQHAPPAYLADLAARFSSAPGSASSLPAEFHAHPPLLYQLLSLTEASMDEPRRRQATAKAITGLAAIAGRPGGSDQLERLMLETLGLVTNRLDAWATSVHTSRLAELRGDDDPPAGGIHIGAYGLVCDLAPSPDRGSNGFVHAPSLSHAATAAVLRSAWLSHGTTAADSAAAVDVSSARIRTAQWVIDGIRNGQSLGELLGYRFERLLHDTAASGATLDIRRQVIALRRADTAARLQAGGSRQDANDTTENEPVDGVELLEMRDRLALGGRLAPVAAQIRRGLDDIAGVADAVADAALFDGTHQLLQGNSARAAAMFDSMSLGLGTPPELRSHVSAHGGLTVEHRVLVVLDARSRPDGRWPQGMRGMLAPALERWVQSLLPDPASVLLRVVDRPEDGVRQIPLADLGMAALDVVALTHPDPTGITPALRCLLQHRFGLSDDFRVLTGEGGGVTFEEVQLICREIAAVLQRSVVGTNAAFHPATGDEPEGAPPPALVDHVDLLRETFADALADDFPSRWEVLARYGWAPGTDPEATRAQLAARLAKLDAKRSAEGVSATDTLTALFASAPHVVPEVTYSASSAGALVRFSAELASSDEIDDWLDAVAHVRPDVARLSGALMLSNLAGVPASAVAVGQDVMDPGERWAATHLPPPGAAGRVSVCAATVDGWIPREGDEVCVLIIDAWSEQIPRADAVTGVAFHYDAPSNRPPQSWLLAAPAADRPWSMGLIADMVLDTVDWARKRMVAPEDLGDWGHGIPTSVVPGVVTPWPSREETES